MHIFMFIYATFIYKYSLCIIVSGRKHEEVKRIQYIDFSLYSSVNRLPPSGGVWMLWMKKSTWLVFFINLLENIYKESMSEYTILTI